MVKNMGFIREKISKKLSGIFAMSKPLSVFADEPTPPATPTINYEDLIAKARKEEKDKLYPKITALEGQIADLTSKVNAHLLTIGQKESEIETLTKKLKEAGKGDSEEVVKLTAQVKKLEEDLEKAKKEVPDVKALEEKIKAEITSEYEVKLYREQKLGEAKDSIIPELVIGSTKEEIDAAVEASKKRYKELFDKANKHTTTHVPAANPSSKLNTSKFTLEDLAKMDVRSEEYREARRQLGLK